MAHDGEMIIDYFQGFQGLGPGGALVFRTDGGVPPMRKNYSETGEKKRMKNDTLKETKDEN